MDKRLMDALKIQFGSTGSWEIPLDDRITSLTGPEEYVSDVAGAMDSALTQPIDFPSLDQAVVPDDRLVLAVDPAIPFLPEVVSVAAKWFCDRGTDASNVRIVIAGDGPTALLELEEAILAKLGVRIPTENHDADDSKKIAYVAANEASDPIYMNRSIVDADVVIPITCARPSSALDYFGGYSLFPLVSDRTTRGSFYSLPKLDDSASRAKLIAWADQAAWWVGVVAGIQIIPAGDNNIAAVLAGQIEPLEAASQQAILRNWNQPAAASDLVIAMLDGQAWQQSWLSLARALHIATKCVTPQGTIVLATQLKDAGGKGLNRLRSPHQSPESIAKKLSTDPCDDALAASVILQATASNHVFLISHLGADAVESLGLGAIGDAEQLTRLIQQHDACTVLSAAQHRGLSTCPTS